MMAKMKRQYYTLIGYVCFVLFMLDLIHFQAELLVGFPMVVCAGPLYGIYAGLEMHAAVFWVSISTLVFTTICFLLHAFGPEKWTWAALIGGLIGWFVSGSIAEIMLCFR